MDIYREFCDLIDLTLALSLKDLILRIVPSSSNMVLDALDIIDNDNN